MTGEIRAEPDALVQLAAQTLTAADRVTDALTTLGATAAPGRAAYGDTGVGASVHRAAESVLADAQTAIGRLAGVYEGDVDRLYRVAFAYRQADAEAVARQQRAGRGPI